MKLISEKELANRLENFTGASFVSIVTETEPKMNVKSRLTKEPNPYIGRVKRVAVRGGMIGADYSNAVQNRRVAEDHPGAMDGQEFRAEALWNGKGEHVNGSKCLARHKGTGALYLVFYPRQDSEGDVVVKESEWLCDGQPIEVSALASYLPPVREGSPRQETERPVAWRTIALENITSITIGGETFTITR